MRKLIILGLISGLLNLLAAQAPESLEAYFRLGLRENLALKQKQTDYKISLLALEKARGMFLPNLTFDSRYSRAGGGRMIDFPLGDLFNPVYGSLNQIFQSLGQPTRNFPMLENQQIPFLREKEHETKLRLIQPVFQPALYHNAEIFRQKSLANRAALNSYKNTLIRDIGLAYFNYMLAMRSVTIYRGALKLLADNVALSQALVRNGVRTREVLFQARAEQARVEQQLNESLNRQHLAASYFNFLLNRALDDTIRVSETLPFSTVEMADPQALRQQALRNRFEFLQLQRGQAAQKAVSSLHNSSWLPSLTLVADYGFQGENYRFSDKDDYWMASALLQWNIYNGGQDETQKQMARLSLQQLQLRERELTRQIELDVDNQYRQLINRQKSFITAQKQARAAEEAFRIIQRQYREGQAVWLTLNDAREKRTRARLALEISQIEIYKQRIKLAAATGALLQPFLSKEK